jgi:hypothetical protein
MLLRDSVGLWEVLFMLVYRIMGIGRFGFGFGFGNGNGNGCGREGGRWGDIELEVHVIQVLEFLLGF